MPADAFTIKQGDTLPALVRVLENSDGSPINLAGSTIEFHMRLSGASTLKVNRAASIGSAVPSSTDTATDVLTFSADPGWITGDKIFALATGGGLTSGVAYYYRRITATTGTLHTTQGGARANTELVDLTASITTTLGVGRVVFEWLVADTDTAGTYHAEYEITFSAGAPLTVPNDRNMVVTVVEELG